MTERRSKLALFPELRTNKSLLLSKWWAVRGVSGGDSLAFEAIRARANTSIQPISGSNRAGREFIIVYLLKTDHIKSLSFLIEKNSHTRLVSLVITLQVRAFSLAAPWEQGWTFTQAVPTPKKNNCIFFCKWKSMNLLRLF